MIQSQRHVGDMILVRDSPVSAIVCEIIEIIWQQGEFTYKVKALCNDGIHYGIAFVNEVHIVDMPVPEDFSR